MVNNLQSVTEELSEAAMTIYSTSEHLSATSNQISASIEENSNITEETSSSVLELSASMEQIESNAQSLSNNVSDTATAIEQVMSAIQSVSDNVSLLSTSANDNLEKISEMVLSTEQVSENVFEVGKSSEYAVKEAKNGEHVIKNTIQGIYDISLTMKEIEDVIIHLNKRSHEIGSIVDTINDIASQTNLLALNAAIESARAGEHGRGFAVVANEVRKLAERSANSAKDIVTIIKSVQGDTENALLVTKQGSQKANEGVSLITEAGNTLDKIIKTISSTNEMMIQINKITEQQTQSSHQMVHNIEKMVSLTKHVDLATFEQSKNSQQILFAVEKMNNMTSQVTQAVKGQKIGNEQIVNAITGITIGSKCNLEASSQIVHVAGELNKQAKTLQMFISTFKLNTENKIKLLRLLCTLSIKISQAIHELQKERAKSSIFIGSGGTKYSSELKEQIVETDIRLDHLYNFIRENDFDGLKDKFYDSLKNALANLEKLNEKRNSVQLLKLSSREEIFFYTNSIELLLKVISYISHISIDFELSKAVAAYVSFLYIKEKTGQERAILCSVFSSDKFEEKEFNQFVGIIKSQDMYLNIFFSYATQEQIDLYKNKIKVDCVTEVETMRNIALKNLYKGKFEVDPDYWYKNITKKIDLYKEIEDQLSTYINKMSHIS